MSTLLPLHADPDRPARLGARWRPVPSARVIGHAVVLAGALLMFAPFYLMMVFATHTNAEILSVPPPLWFGDALGDNLALLLDRLPFFWRNLGWSFYVAGAVTVLNLLLCSLAGHAFALLDFPGRDRLFGLVLATMLLPGFLFIARKYRLPLAIREIGSSAGLNLNFDRFHYRYGPLEWGDAGSPDAPEPPFSPAAQRNLPLNRAVLLHPNGRVSSAVEQRFCKPKVGGSIPSTGTRPHSGNVPCRR